ncbi:MAG: hypothetical protein ACI4NG_04210 [Candidatus Gallimonas sp.]
MQVSTMIGKQLLSPAGDSLGYVTDVKFTRRYDKISVLCCVDEDEEEFFLPARAVLACSDVVLAGPSRLSSVTGTDNPVGKIAYSSRGELLGTVCDVICDRETPMIAVSRGDLRIFYPLSLSAVRETVVVRSENEKAPARKSRCKSRVCDEPVKTPPCADRPREPLSSEDSAENRLNLLGRTVKKSVYGEHGALLIAAGEIVTQSTLLKARRNNRLLQLTVNTLTNVW